MKTLDYELWKETIINRINAQTSMVLATSVNDRVTARTVFCVSNGLRVYFLTSKAYMKVKQIERNPLVALCFENVQIQGNAVIHGHPSEESNQERLTNCANVSKEFLLPCKYKNTVLIEIVITKIECWVNGGREYLDVETEKCYRVY